MNSFQNNTYDTGDPHLVSAIDDLPLWSAPFGQKILDIVRMQKNMSVLDVGCGLGFPLIELSQRLGDSCRCYGIDPWIAAVERARHKVEAWGIQNIDFREGAAEELPFDDNTFDLVISNNGLNNVDDESKSMSEIARVCKPGAQFVLTFNRAATFVEFYDVFKDVLHQHKKYEVLKKLDQHIDSKRKPIEVWLELLAQNDFAVQHTFKDEFNFRYVDGTSMLNHFFIKLAFLPSWLGLVEGEEEDIFLHLEHQLNTIGELKLTVPWIAIEAVKES